MKKNNSVRTLPPSSLRVAFICGMSLIVFAMIDLPGCSRGGMVLATDRGAAMITVKTPRTNSVVARKNRWLFACIQSGTVISFNSESASDHLAAPLMIYDEELKNPIDANLPGEEMESFANIVPLKATEQEFTFYAYGRPIRRPMSNLELFSRTTSSDKEKLFEINVDLQSRVGVAREVDDSMPVVLPQMIGQNPKIIVIDGQPAEIETQESIEQGFSPSGLVLTRGELVINSAGRARNFPYPHEVFERFARNPHVVKNALFRGLWVGANEIYASLTGELGQIIFRLDLSLPGRGTWTRLTDDHCDSEIVGIEQSQLDDQW